MANLPPIEIRTPRLLLRRPDPREAAAVFAGWKSDAEVCRYDVHLPHRRVEDTAAYLEWASETWSDDHSGDTRSWILEHRDTGQPIGGFEARDLHGIALGYALARPWWGQGLMSEAVQAAVRVAFRLTSVQRVWAWCDAEHAASARVLEKSGFIFEGVLRRFCVHPAQGDVPRDCRCYAITQG